MIICADDYGLNDPTSEGILDLVASRSVSAVSCMMTGKNISAHMKQILPFRPNIDLGLHLVLTNENCLADNSRRAGLAHSDSAFFSSFRLYQKIFCGQISPEPILIEFRRQLEIFCELTGALPDFIDGHEHIHQLPVVRQAYIALLNFIKGKAKIYARNSFMPRSIHSYYFMKDWRVSFNAFWISLLGQQLKAKLQANDIPTNEHLFGYHNYLDPNGFAESFGFSLSSSAQTNDVFFAHPGFYNPINQVADPLASARPMNLEFLKLKAPAKLREQGFSMNRFQF